MIRWPDIPYLRWARSQADPPYPEIALTQSGMAPPDPALFGHVGVADLLHFPVGDHPPLAFRLAEEWKVAPETVLVQPGTHLSILLLLAARLGERPGPVVVEEPTYEPLWAIPRALGAEVLWWPRPRATGFALDPGAVDRLADAEPSVVVLSHPHNPTGATLGDADLEVLRDLQDRTGCAVISDEVYADFDPDLVSPRLRLDDVAAVRSFTKVMGLATLRCSGITAPRDWIERTAALTDHGAVAVPGPSQALAHRAWDQRHVLWQRARETAARGREVVEEWLDRQDGRIDAPLPATGIICFPRLDEETHRAAVAQARRHGVQRPLGLGLDGADEGSELWIEDLRRLHGVQLTPGAFFGDARAFRLGFGGDAEALREGLSRLDDHLQQARTTATEGA
jgi:aspartate/methionine/tyrosine aminotransferase